MYDKFKQINRFVEIIDDEIKNIEPQTQLNVIDFGLRKIIFDLCVVLLFN